MSVESNEPLSGEKIHIVVTLPEDATGTVTVTINGKDYTVDVKDGKAVFDIPGLAAGKYDIVVYYSGDDKYDSCQIDYIITVKENGKKHNNQSDIVSPSMAVKAGNPIFVLLLALMTIGSATIRRSKK